MKDYRALSVVLSAFNMSKEIAYPALVRKLLTEDPSSSGSAARKIGNASYYRFATAMGQYTTNPFSDASGLKAVTDAYVTNAYEAAQGKQVPGLADALAFKRQASQITSVANLMSNKSLTKVAVAQTALDWSTFGVMSYERQVAVLTKGFNAADYQDSAKVDRMAEQYLVMAGQNPTAWDASTATAKTLASLLDSVGTTDPILSALLPATGNFSTAGNPVLSLFA